MQSAEAVTEEDLRIVENRFMYFLALQLPSPARSLFMYSSF